MSGVQLSRFNRWSYGILRTDYTRYGAEAAAAVCSWSDTTPSRNAAAAAVQTE